MKFDPEAGVWINADGARFIRNEFNPSCPIYLTVTDTVWGGDHLQKSYELTWPASLHPDLRDALEIALRV